MLYLLVFSFILISISSVPLYINTASAEISLAYGANKVPGHRNEDVVIRSFSDVPEAEILYKYHILQNIETKRLSDESSSFMFTGLFIPSSCMLIVLLGLTRHFDPNSIRIVFFQHSKDGMV